MTLGNERGEIASSGVPDTCELVSTVIAGAADVLAGLRWSGDVWSRTGGDLGLGVGWVVGFG